MGSPKVRPASSFSSSSEEEKQEPVELPAEVLRSVADRLVVRYVALSTVRKWERNPKRHDSRIRESIETHGFGDPPKYDASLKALVYGNGRTEALEELLAAGADPPRGIVAYEGEWYVPVVFGVDQESRAAAEAFAIDHNAVGLGPGFDFGASLLLWDDDALDRIAEDFQAAGEKAVLPVSFPDGWETIVFPEPPKGTKGGAEATTASDGVVVELLLSKAAFEELWPILQEWSEKKGVDLQVAG